MSEGTAGTIHCNWQANALTSALTASVILALFLALLPFPAASQEVAVTHCLESCPQYRSTLAGNNSKVVIHHLYAAGLNRYSRRADWVAYRITPAAVGIASLLPRDWQPDRLAGFGEIAELADLAEFEPDDNLPEVSSAASAYGGVSVPPAGAHSPVRLAPLTSFAKTPYWSELNNTSNMLPMPSPLRRGPWLRLEQALNTLVSSRDQLHVIAGPLYYRATPPGSSVLNPGENLAGYFKIVSTDSGSAAFLFPHDLPQHESYCGRIVDVREVERLTGLDLLAGRSTSLSWQLLEELGCNRPVGP